MDLKVEEGEMVQSEEVKRAAFLLFLHFSLKFFLKNYSLKCSCLNKLNHF